MQFNTKKYLISIFLIFSLLADLYAQEKKFPFAWLDQSENRLAGNLTANFQSRGDGLYQLVLSVTWFDSKGQPVTAPAQMPFLCLSKWDLLIPEQHLKCTTFDQRTTFIPPFQTTGSLDFTVLNDYEGDVTLSVGLQYALSRKLYDSGKSEWLDLMGAKSIVLVYPVTSGKKKVQPDIAANNRLQPESAVKNPATLKRVAASYNAISLKVSDLERNRTSVDLSRPGYLTDLEAMITNIDNERSMLNPDSLPQDTVRAYRERYNHLNSQVLALRTAFLRFQVSQSTLSAGTDASGTQRKNDSLRGLVKIRFEPVMLVAMDSLDRITLDQKSIALKISEMLGSGKGPQPNDPVLDSLIRQHGLVKNALQRLSLAHENLWSNYRIDLGGLIPVREVENVHHSFLQKQSDLQSAIDQVDNGLEAFRREPSVTPWYASNRFIWTGLLVVIILVVVSGIWSSARNRKILKDRLHILERTKPAGQEEKSLVTGILTSEVQQEYYTLDYMESIPDSIVGKMHVHNSGIRAVYQLVQGALMERRGNDFGGYLFGNQYRLSGKGSGRSELFIEKVCDSKYLRSSIQNDSEARAELIDELNLLVSQNKKYRLIGWFTASPDKSLEIPEGLMKIHRAFFKEKWQVGIMLNPGSEVLQGAGFYRRKSGYLDPLPDPAAFLNWDDLYRYSVDPTSKPLNGGITQPSHDRHYSTIRINNAWADSVVTAVHFDATAMHDIHVAAAGQAIPRDTFQVVGYLYGTASASLDELGTTNEYEVFVDRFIEISNELTPRDIPGMLLLGWWGQANVDVMNYLQNAVDYHVQSFREAYQICCLVNPGTGELRVVTRKHSLEMNNSTIETEEYSVKVLQSR